MNDESVPSLDAVLLTEQKAPNRPAPDVSNALRATVGVVGELLVTAGILVGMFTSWQLFYTDWQSGRVQADAIEALEWPEQALPVDLEGKPVTEPIADVAAAPIEIIPEDAKTFSALGAPVMAEPSVGTTFAVVHVPAWGVDYAKPVSEGTDKHQVLNKLGIGHYEGTAMPGAIGNFAIAGHRTTYGKPFTNIQSLAVGDAVIVQTADAWFVYRVTSTAIVPPGYPEAIAPVPDQPGVAATAASITLTSCHPKYTADQRYIVWGELEYWAPSGSGYPSELFEEAL